ncbi:MAG TPA: ATP synthase F1 subunit gamma [Candidatus Saccharimonas sp.]|nr:ATP synthase F1 subunit gamma [Candidatus Saccharimonas sp.]
MPNTIAIKRRIGSVKNTRQITKAMQLVAAARMRKAQEAAQRSRTYNDMARELLTRLRQITDVAKHPLFVKRHVKARLLVVITSDRGLAGAYNSNALKRYVAELKKDQAAGVKSYTIAIGQKAGQLVGRLGATEAVGMYRDLPEQPTVADLQPIMRAAAGMFTDGTVDAVDVIYTHYYSTVRQEAHTLPLLPAGFSDAEVGDDLRLAGFEPSAEAVLEATARRLLDAQLLQALLDSFASEQSMRMLAMKSATDNANELVDDLTLAFNNARQANITQELAEITGGAEALN